MTVDQKRTWSARSIKNLTGVHPVLVRVANEALQLSPIDFVVTEGLRTLERQKALRAAGASRTLNSKHLTGHAIDVAALVDGQIRWDWPLYRHIAGAFKVAAKNQAIHIKWGGDWQRFPDGPHFEIDPKLHP